MATSGPTVSARRRVRVNMSLVIVVGP
jgi:hypothetical protein